MLHCKSLKKLTPSLRRDFTLLMVIVLLGMMGLCYYFTQSAYREQSNLIVNRLILQSKRIELSYKDLFDFTQSQLQYISRRISEHGTDVTFIQELLRTFATPKDATSVWSTFLWCDENHTVRVTNDFGILEDSLNLSNRDYIEKAIKNPATLHLGKPVYGVTSGNWIIPAGMGLTSSDGTYLGTVVSGLIISKLIHYLEKAINVDGVSFGIFSNDLTLIAASTDFLESVESNHLIDTLKTMPSPPPSKFSLTPNTLSFMSRYGIVQQLGNAPFLLVISYNKHQSDSELYHLLMIRIIEICGLGSIALLTLLLLKYRLIMPLTQLSLAARDIAAENKIQTKLPHSPILEIHTLSKNILQVKRQILKIRRIERRLLMTTAKAAQANIAKSEFLASMGHELRTPLNAIIGYSEMMHDEVLGPITNQNYVEYIKDIHYSGKHLLRLINEILDISQAQTDQLELCEEPFNVIEPLSHALTLLANPINQKQMIITTHTLPNLPLLYADKARLSQIFFHLLSNAIKFSKPKKNIDIHIFCNQDGFHIKIQDYGIGMTARDIPIALEKFSQLDSSISRVEEGIGIGLWLTRLFVDIHQGIFNITSTEGVGTTVTIIFPPNRVISETLLS